MECHKITAIILCAGNEKLDAEVVATTTEPGADDSAATVNDKKSESTGPPARPQPPVCVLLSLLYAECVSVSVSVYLCVCVYLCVHVCVH